MRKKPDSDAPLPSFEEDDDEHASTRAFRPVSASPAASEGAPTPLPPAPPASLASLASLASPAPPEWASRNELPRFALSDDGVREAGDGEVETRPVALPLPRFPMSSEDVTSPLEALPTVPTLPTFPLAPDDSTSVVGPRPDAARPPVLGFGSASSSRMRSAHGGETVPLVGGGGPHGASLGGGAPPASLGGASLGASLASGPLGVGGAGSFGLPPPGPRAPSPADPASSVAGGLLSKLLAGLMILGVSALVGGAAATWLARRRPVESASPSLSGAEVTGAASVVPTAQLVWPPSPSLSSGAHAVSPQAGRIELPASPPGGQVWVDGALVAEPSPPLLVACGKHTLRILRAGQPPRVEVVDVPCGGHVVVR